MTSSARKLKVEEILRNFSEPEVTVIKSLIQNYLLLRALIKRDSTCSDISDMTEAEVAEVQKMREMDASYLNAISGAGDFYAGSKWRELVDCAKREYDVTLATTGAINATKQFR